MHISVVGRDADGINEGTVVGDVVGDAVGDFVDDAVGDIVGDAVGDFVDDAVGDAVGDVVGDAVEDVDGAVVLNPKEIEMLALLPIELTTTLPPGNPGIFQEPPALSFALRTELL